MANVYTGSSFMSCCRRSPKRSTRRDWSICCSLSAVGVSCPSALASTSKCSPAGALAQSRQTRDLVVIHAVSLHDKILKIDAALFVSVAPARGRGPLGYLLITKRPGGRGSGFTEATSNAATGAGAGCDCARTNAGVKKTDRRTLRRRTDREKAMRRVSVVMLSLKRLGCAGK